MRVSLNDHKQEYEAPAAFKPPLGKWSTLVCGVDLPSHSLTAYVNGKKMLDVQLPQGFTYNVKSWKFSNDQKLWMFQDSGKSSAYHGLVGDFSYFNTKLPNDAMQQLSAVIKP